MNASSVSKALKPNPSLAPFSILIGEWETQGTHPLLPGKVLHGHVSFKWIEGGAFMIMHSSINQKEFPDGIAIFGSDDSSEELSMLYFDERNVSRKYICTLKDNVWKWWRDDPEFSQKFTCAITDNGNRIIGKGEMSRSGGPWEKDLELTYTRKQ
jgi:hypothetical protein